MLGECFIRCRCIEKELMEASTLTLVPRTDLFVSSKATETRLVLHIPSSS